MNRKLLFISLLAMTMSTVGYSYDIVVKRTAYHRTSAHEWCVGMRVFRTDGGSLPASGYDWYRADYPSGSFTLVSSNIGRSRNTDGLNSGPQRWRFKVKFVDAGDVTHWSPEIVVGCDMSFEDPWTGCSAADALPDSDFSNPTCIQY